MGRYRVFLPPRLPRNLRPIDITSSAEEKVSSNDAHYLSPNPRRVSKSSHRSGHRLTHSRRPTTYSGWSVPYKPSPSHDEPSPRRPSTVRSESTFRRFNQFTSLSTTGQRNNAAECLQMYGRHSCPSSATSEVLLGTYYVFVMDNLSPTINKASKHGPMS